MPCFIELRESSPLNCSPPPPPDLPLDDFYWYTHVNSGIQRAPARLVSSLSDDFYGPHLTALCILFFSIFNVKKCTSWSVETLFTHVLFFLLWALCHGCLCTTLWAVALENDEERADLWLSFTAVFNCSSSFTKVGFFDCCYSFHLL